jgi:hypothetical protein
MRSSACPVEVCLHLEKYLLSPAKELDPLPNSSSCDKRQLGFRLQFNLSISDATQTRHSIPIVPRPPQTCQRLTTNRPIESAPDKPPSLISTFSAGALPIGI